MGFYSKRLSSTQAVYSTFDRELLAAYQAVLHFKPVIEAQRTTVFTDHEPLVSEFHSISPAKSDRQQRHIGVLTEYLCDCVYIRGQENVVADALPALLQLIDLEAIADAQSTDADTIKQKPQLKAFQLQQGTLWCNVDSSFPRPFVPATQRSAIFHKFHHLSHPGAKATVKLIRDRYVWPFMEKEIREWCRTCEACQSSKVTRHTKPGFSFQVHVSGRFQVVHVDIVGPPPPSRHTNGFNGEARYPQTAIGHASNWIEVAPICNINAETVANTVLNCWIFIFGVYLYVITDRAT